MGGGGEEEERRMRKRGREGVGVGRMLTFITGASKNQLQDEAKEEGAFSWESWIGV